MPTAWLSTLKNLQHTLQVNPAELAERFPETLTAPENDLPITISTENKNWLDTQISNLRYPACKGCQASVLSCSCPYQSDYETLQQEHQSLLATIDTTEQSIQKLINAPFRQLRNAFGFCATIFGGTNLILANVAMSTAALYVSLALPPLLLGGYVYYRGRREEGKINADMQADWLDKKINLLCKEREAMELRIQQNLAPSSVCEKRAKPKLPKEKRGIAGNALSHFIGSSLATVGITYTAIKYGAFSTLVTAGSAACWGATGGLGGTVGIYFAYKRYTHLSHKIKTEILMATLVTSENDLNMFISQLKQPTAEIFSTHGRVRQELSLHPVNDARSTLTTPLLADDQPVFIRIDSLKTPATQQTLAPATKIQISPACKH